MRRVMAVVLAAAVCGCVRPAPQMPAAQGPWGAGSTNWRALRALPQGQFIVVTVDGGETRASSRWDVSDTAVTLWYDWGPYTIPRASVTQVLERVEIGTKQKMPRHTVAGSAAMVIGGLIGYLGSKNKVVTEWSGATAVAGALLFVTTEPEVKPVYADRLVYIRP